MSRTGGKWEGDLPFTDAKIAITPNDFTWTAIADAVITRNAAFDWSVNQPASKTVTYLLPISNLVMERLGMADDSALLENYGTATPGNAVGGGNAAYTGNQGGPYQVSGRPPYPGASQLTPPVGFRAKGFKCTDITLVYQITTLALTSINLQINKTVFANNVALAQSVILANGANGLQTATQASPYVTKVNVGANAAFNVTDNSEVAAELVVITPATSLFRLYRAYLHGSYNYA